MMLVALVLGAVTMTAVVVVMVGWANIISSTSTRVVVVASVVEVSGGRL